MITMSNKEQYRAEIVGLLTAGSISQQRAAELLELSTRQVRRLQRTYEENGIAGLVSRKRGRPGNNQLNEFLVQAVETRVRERYPDFGPTLAHEKLIEEDGFRLSLSSVRKIMIESQIWVPRKRKDPKVHPRRERRPRAGELLQIDGSHHDWFEGRADKCCLLVFIDDATSAILGLRFFETESCMGYFSLMHDYLLERGRPLATYSDKHGIFRINHGSTKDINLTQFGTAMKKLDIQVIYAHSPQAKGRVERANGTLQDRLVKELRLRGISSIEEANAFLPEFQKDYNQRFAVAPKVQTDAHRVLDQTYDLKRILSIVDRRTVSKSLSFQFGNTHFQILEEGWRARQLIGERVDVGIQIDGEIRVFYKGRELIHTTSDLKIYSPEVLDSKELNPQLDRWLNKSKPHRPAANHPYRRIWKI